jgi:hypothetical protein
MPVSRTSHGGLGLKEYKKTIVIEKLRYFFREKANKSK